MPARATGPAPPAIAPPHVPGPLAERRPPLAHEALELRQVQRAGLDRQQVTRRARHEHVRADQLPQPRDVALYQLGRGGRRAFAPELVDDPVARYHLARVQREQGEQRALLRRPERNGHAVHNRHQRPQHAELDHPAPTLLQPALDAEHRRRGRTPAP